MLAARRCLFAPSQQCLPLAGACLLVCFFCLCAFPCSNTTTNNALCASPFLHTLCYYINNDHHDQCKTILRITRHAFNSRQQSSAIAFVLCDTNQPCWWQQQPNDHHDHNQTSNDRNDHSTMLAAFCSHARNEEFFCNGACPMWQLTILSSRQSTDNNNQYVSEHYCFSQFFWPYCFQSKWIQSYVENHPMAMTTLSVRFIPRFSATASILSMAYASNHLSKDKQLSSRPCDGASFMTVRPLRQHVQCDNGYDNMSYATTVRPCENQHFCLNDNGNHARCCSNNCYCVQNTIWL